MLTLSGKSALTQKAWRSALKTMQLTAEQRRQILELRRRYLRRAGAIVHDRQRIASQLQVRLSAGPQGLQSCMEARTRR